MRPMSAKQDVVADLEQSILDGSRDRQQLDIRRAGCDLGLVEALNHPLLEEWQVARDRVEIHLVDHRVGKRAAIRPPQNRCPEKERHAAVRALRAEHLRVRRRRGRVGPQIGQGSLEQICPGLLEEVAIAQVQVSTDRLGPQALPRRTSKRVVIDRVVVLAAVIARDALRIHVVEHHAATRPEPVDG